MHCGTDYMLSARLTVEQAVYIHRQRATDFACVQTWCRRESSRSACNSEPLAALFVKVLTGSLEPAFHQSHKIWLIWWLIRCWGSFPQAAASVSARGWGSKMISRNGVNCFKHRRVGNCVEGPHHHEEGEKDALSLQSQKKKI